MRATDSLLEERESTHGDSTKVYTAVYKVWKAMIELEETSASPIHPASMVELMMDAFKSCRLISNPKWLDNYRDKRGYLRLIEKREGPSDADNADKTGEN